MIATFKDNTACALNMLMARRTMSRSRITTNKEDAMRTKEIPPVHPGEVLEEEFLKPLAITQYRLAKDISVPARRINEIVLRKRGITADTALRLGRYFGTTADFWLNLQTGFEKETAMRGKTSAALAKIVPLAKSKTQRILAA